MLKAAIREYISDYGPHSHLKIASARNKQRKPKMQGHFCEWYLLPEIDFGRQQHQNGT
jgi:hypothetical protein